MKYLKAGLAVLFVLLVSFFVVKSCVYPKRFPAGETSEFRTPFFSKPVSFSHPALTPPPVETEAVKYPGVLKTSPQVAIILDDWGKNYRLLKSAIEIGRPVTLAVIPHLSKSRQIAKEAHENGLGVMLHLPMEPKNKGEPMEPHTIMTTMTEGDILNYLDEAIASVPYLEGVNNHMGSSATSDARVMKIVFKRLKFKNLFFIDSRVASSSVSEKISKEVGIRFATRDVFIDNENQLEPIKKQLEKAKRIALSHGEAIVIGHDRKWTVQAIKEMVPVFEKAGVKFVLAKDIVKSET